MLLVLTFTLSECGLGFQKQKRWPTLMDLVDFLFLSGGSESVGALVLESEVLGTSQGER